MWRRAVRGLAERVATTVPEPVRNALRPFARSAGLAAQPGAWWESATPPWRSPTPTERSAARWCNVCRWYGDAFLGIADGESAECPRCGSIARDRFLLWCFLSRTEQPRDLRVLETSPRLGEHYRTRMRRWFDYTCSDFDLSTHRGDVVLDLQDIQLPDASVDVLLTPHVLEHVPDTARALREVIRILVPGGRMYLQVPLVYGTTAPPATPEFHADNTPVFFNFGWDLTDLLVDAGFTARVLVPDEYVELLAGRAPAPGSPAEGFHLDQLVADVRLSEIEAALDARTAGHLGIAPPYHFATWEAIRPERR
jgi:SAM-dependent methyltransferase